MVSAAVVQMPDELVLERCLAATGRPHRGGCEHLQAAMPSGGWKRGRILVACAASLAGPVRRSNGGVDDEPQQGRQPQDEQEAEDEFEATRKVHGGNLSLLVGKMARWR